MDLNASLLLLIAGGTLLVYILGLLSSNWNRKLPPGPFKLPLLGNNSLMAKYCVKYKGMHNGLLRLCEKFSTDILMIRLNGDDVVVVQSEGLIDQVCTREEFQARPDTFFIRHRSMGTRNGITMTDGPLWQEQRAFAVRHMHNLGLGKSRMEFLIIEEIQNMFSALKDGGSNIQIRQHISACVLNVLWAMVTGSRFKDEATLKKLISLMERRAKAFNMGGGVLCQFPWVRFIAPERTGYNLITQLNTEFKNFILDIIKEHKATYNKDVTRDFIDAFLHEMNKNDSQSFFTDDQLIMVCMDFFIAGSQTTSSTLDFALLHMIFYPDVQQRAQEELDRVLTPNQIPSIVDKARLPYTDAVLMESQRVSHVVPVIGPRRVLSDTKLGGYDIPKGTTILMNLVPLAKDPAKWDQPNSFVPERFTEEKGRANYERNIFSFGKGKRRCPGEALARSFMFIFFASFLHRFKLEQNSDNPPTLDPIPGITLSTTPYDLKLSLRHPLKT
uniref:Cytochrome P450 305a1 n=2 Tax=Lygus hesperus TaxID=30085 RepID=A0A0K8SBH9_LYGHE